MFAVTQIILFLVEHFGVFVGMVKNTAQHC
jgi:hypothetical protein